MRAEVTIAAAVVASILNAAEPSMVTGPTGILVEGVECYSDPTQTYTLYLPAPYTIEEKWPALLIFDPRGRSTLAAEIFREAAERWGWILISSNDTRSDGPMGPNKKALNALWPEVHVRYAADHERLYAAGLSGGGAVAYLVGKRTGALAGVIAAGSRLLPDLLRGTTFALFASAGDRDFNYQEMIEADALVAKQGNPHRFEAFPGLHTWMPAELAADAVAWMELVAMQRGLRPRDQGAIEELYADHLTAAHRLKESGDALAALRRLEMVARTFDGLTDVAGPKQAAARFATGREVKQALKDERKWRTYEESMRRRFAQTYTRLRLQDEPISASELRRQLGVGALQKRASAEGIEGGTARRLLSTLYAETSYYAFYPLLGADRWDAAVPLLTVATEVYDGWGSVWPTWYNLACAHAVTGHRGQALRALERALAEGFANADQLRTDADLASLRGMDEFQAIVDSLGP